MKYEFKLWHLLVLGAVVLLLIPSTSLMSVSETEFDTDRIPSILADAVKSDTFTKIDLDLTESKPSFLGSLSQTIFTGSSNYDQGDVISIWFTVTAEMQCYSPRANYQLLRNGVLEVDGSGTLTPIIGSVPVSRSLNTEIVALYSLPLGSYDAVSFVTCEDLQSTFWTQNNCDSAPPTSICYTYSSGDPISDTDIDYDVFSLNCAATTQCDSFSCYDGDVWCYDDCGVRTTIDDSCGTSESCPTGGNSCVSSCGTPYTYACHTDGNIWSFDSCGQPVITQEVCDTWEQCSSATCALLPGKCDVDAHCDAGQDCINHICEGEVLPPAPEPDCSQNTDCGVLEVCTSGSCVNVDCLIDSDCDAGLYCSSGNTCIAAVDCVIDDDCSDLEICAEGTCTVDIECNIDADCASGELCNNESVCMSVVEDEEEASSGGGGGSSSPKPDVKEDEKVAPVDEENNNKTLLYVLLLGGVGYYLYSTQKKNGKKKKKKR